MQLTLGLIQKLTGGELLRGDREAVVSDVLVDSRGALPLDSLFVAIVGTRFDGHEFVNEAMVRGAGAALISTGDCTDYPHGALIKVSDTLKGLQDLARGWRELYEIPVVAITGSNGKTIVKDMLAAMVGQEKTVYRSPGSYNSQVGVPLAVLGIRSEHEIAIIEAGISRANEMEKLRDIVQPTLGILTNIGLAHSAGLPTLELTAREKLKLFQQLNEDSALVFPRNDSTLNGQSLPGKPVAFHVKHGVEHSVEQSALCDPEDSIHPCYQISNVEFDDQGTAFIANFPDGRHSYFRMNIPGLHNLHNAAAALTAAAELGISMEAMHEGLASFELSSLRLEMHTTQSGITLINDAYNSDPVSAREALNVLKHYAGGQRAIAIFGDMLDLGQLTFRAHHELGGVVARVGVDRLICFGDNARFIGESAIKHGVNPTHIIYARDLDDLHDRLELLLLPGDVVLFKASRNIGLERAAQRILESVASARLMIDLDAISDNFHLIRRHVNTRIMAVVKSFGYGNDATRVSQTLIQQGVDALAVAYPDEAIPLRQKGLSVPILVTNIFAAEADKIVKYDLTALIYSHNVASALQRQAERMEKTVNVHLEINTGMNRVGLQPDEAICFAKELKQYPNLCIEGLMTHFAAADDPTEDIFTAHQISLADNIRAKLAEEGIAIKIMHLANSAGLWRFPDARVDMVRVGLGLYGLHPSQAVAQIAKGTRHALTFTTRVIHLHEIEAGESVGYGRTWKSPRNSRIATIAAGYNDGLPRYMSNGGEVLINGVRCPIVGNVCMDVTMVDVTDLAHVNIGDEVMLFGEQNGVYLDIGEWAERGNTIIYEILCNISPRVRRIFLKS